MAPILLPDSIPWRGTAQMLEYWLSRMKTEVWLPPKADQDSMMEHPNESRMTEKPI